MPSRCRSIHKPRRRDGRRSPNVRIAVGASSYVPEKRYAVNADAPGSQGDALLTFESALACSSTWQRRMADMRSRSARAKRRESSGGCRVRLRRRHRLEHRFRWHSPLRTSASIEPIGTKRTFCAREDARWRLRKGAKAAARSSSESARDAVGSALFSRLRHFGTRTSTTQSSARKPSLAPSVDSTGNHAQILGFVRRTQPHRTNRCRKRRPRRLWKVARGGADESRRVAVARRALSALGTRYLRDGSVSAGSSIVEFANAVALMLLDTYGLVYRAYFALPGLTTSTGLRSMRLRIHDDAQQTDRGRKPTHVVAAFDKARRRARRVVCGV